MYYGKMEIASLQTELFTQFVADNKNFLEKATISPIDYEKIFKHKKHIVFDEQEPSTILIAQLLTGNLHFCNQHLERMKEERHFAYCVVASGSLEALNWLFENNLTSDDWYEDNIDFGEALIDSQSVQALEWAFSKDLISKEQACFYLLRECWLEGFIWFNNQFPEILFETDKVPQSYSEKIMKVLNQEDKIYWHDQETIRRCQWLTGDIQFYEKYKDNLEEFRREMILSAARSGEVEALDWLFKHKLIESCWDERSQVRMKMIFLLNIVGQVSLSLLIWC